MIDALLVFVFGPFPLELVIMAPCFLIFIFPFGEDVRYIPLLLNEIKR